MRSARQLGVVVGLVVCIVAAACVDMSAPKGAASISLLQLPSLYIVNGDTMRDTNGVAMAPSVIAYDGAGNAVSNSTAQFFITDSLPVAHFGNGKLVGDAIGTVHVIGQVGSVQTPAVAIPVTVAPASMTTSITAATDTLSVPVGQDSATSIGTFSLPITVHGADGTTPVPGVIVSYTLTPQPSTSTTSPSVYFVDGISAISAIDTTDAGGSANHRKLAVNARFLTDASKSGQPALISVTASAKYKGVPLQGAPLTLTLPIKLSFSLH